MIYLFNNSEELLHIISEVDLLEFNHTIKINAFDEAIFELPLSNEYKIILERAIYFGFHHNKEFKVVKITEKSFDDTIIIEGLDRAEYDLRTVKIIQDRRLRGVDARSALTALVEGTFFDVGKVEGITTTASLNFYYATPMEALVKVIEAFNCEFRIRYNFVESKISSRTIDLYKKQGSYTGKQYYHGSDLLKVVYKEDTDNIITALIGRGKGEESGEGYGRRLKFTDVVWSKSNGKPVNKPAGQDYVSLDSVAGEYGIVRDGATYHRWGVFVDENITDPEVLLERTYEQLLEVSRSKITYEADIVELGKNIQLGDRVAIIRDDVNIAFEARIFEINIDKLNHNKSTVKLGDSVSNINPTLERATSIARAMVDEAGRDLELERILADFERKVREKDAEFDEKIRVAKLDIDNKFVEADTKAEEFKATIREEIERDKAEVLGRVRETTEGFTQRFEEEKVLTQALMSSMSDTLSREIYDTARRASDLMAEAKREASTAVEGLRVSTENTLNSIKGSVSNLDRKFDSNGELISLKHYKSQVEQKDREITTKLTALEQYKNQDGTRQTTLLSLAERKTNELLNREISRLSDTYVAKSTLTETIRGSERKIIESIQGVGRNLLLNSSFSKPIAFSNVDSDAVYNDGKGEYTASIDTTEKFKGYNTFKIVSNYAEPNRNQKIGFRVRGGDVTDTNRAFSNRDVMLGFWAKASVSGISMISRVGERNNLPHWSIFLSTDWKYYSFKLLDNTNANAWNDWIVHIRSKGTVWIAQPKIEYGTVSTPWSPAPEDSETFFTDRLATYRREVDNNLTELRGIATDGKSLATRIEADLRGVSTTVTSLSGRLDNLKVGGRNYIRNYHLRTQSFNQVNSTWTFHREVDPKAKSGYKLKAVCTGVTRSGGFHSPLFDLRPAEFLGREMTWSMDIRTNRDIDLGNLGFEKGGLINPYRSTNTWSRAVKTFTVNQSAYYSVAWYSNHWRVGDWIEIRDPQLEDGSVATTPSAAPEDIDDQVFKKSEFRQTDDKIILASGYEISNRKLASMISLTPEGIQAITEKMVITPYNENLVLPNMRSVLTINKRDTICSNMFNSELKNDDEFLITWKGVRNTNHPFGILFHVHFEDNTTSWYFYNFINVTKWGANNISKTFKLTGINKKVRQWKIGYHIGVTNNFGSFTVENCEIYQKKSASLIVDGSITADQIKALAINAGHLAAGAVTSEKILSGAVEAKHLKVDAALIEKLVAGEALITKLLAKQAFINRLNAITINASQIRGGLISGDMIRGGTISGTTISGVTIQGSSKIKIGTYGFLQPITHGLQINAPASQGANYGVGVQIAGSTSGGKPKGIFIYNDPHFDRGASLPANIDDVLLTVNGRMSMCNSYNGELMRGQPIISNFSYANPVPNNYRISFIGWDARYGQLFVDDGTGTNGSWWFSPESSASDIKLKRNIIKTEHKGLEIIEKLNFYEFDWKPDKFGFQKPHTKIGQIAQELEIIDSSLVYKKGDTLAIDDFRMLNVALKAIQELSQENKSMKEEIRILKEKAA